LIGVQFFPLNSFSIFYKIYLLLKINLFYYLSNIMNRILDWYNIKWFYYNIMVYIFFFKELLDLKNSFILFMSGEFGTLWHCNSRCTAKKLNQSSGTPVDVASSCNRHIILAWQPACTNVSILPSSFSCCFHHITYIILPILWRIV